MKPFYIDQNVYMHVVQYKSLDFMRKSVDCSRGAICCTCPWLLCRSPEIYLFITRDPIGAWK